MTAATVLEFDKLPGTGEAYRRVLLGGKPGLKGDATVPRIEARLRGMVAPAAHVRQYRDVCGFATSTWLPLTYPAILASPLHMQMLTSSAFPVALLGLVHLSNSITQHRRISVKERLDIYCWLEGHTRTALGNEFLLHSEVSVGGQLVWSSETRFLQRIAGAKRSKKSPTESPVYEETVDWFVPANTGRRYAPVSGDFNPIHLSDITAKPLGFKRAIAHGMWSLARVAGYLEMHHPAACTYAVEFKLPVFMPAKVSLNYGLSEAGIDLRLTDRDGKKPHMVGSILKL